MRQFIFFLQILMATICSSAMLIPLAGQDYPGIINPESDQNYAPNSSLTFNEDSTAVTFSLQLPAVKVTADNELYPGTYFWHVPGFYPSDIAGTASLPQRTIIFALPSGATNISLHEVFSQWTSIKYYTPTPARPAKYGSSDYTLEEVPPITAAIKKGVAEISKIETYESQTLVFVTISPFSYDRAVNEVEACYDFSYTLSFTPTTVSSRSLKTKSIGTGETKNPYICEMHRSPSNYLIITTHTFKSTINDYADWKRKFGHGVTVLSKRNWTPKEIKDSISAVYNRIDNLNFVILAGPYYDIPAMLSPTYKYYDGDLFPEGEMRTDFYYSCVNGDDDDTPDLYTGRFIADTSEEMAEIIRKEKSFYTSGINYGNFFNNAAHVSRFQTYSDKTLTTSPFIKTSEALRDIVVANGKNVSRIYDADEGAMPQYIVVNGENTLLPEELQYGNFPWSAGTDDVLNQFNTGNFYIMYMAHGAYSGWGQPSFGYSDFNRLNNRDALPVVFSMSCNTGNFVTEDGFARHLLTCPNGGAKAVIASERPSIMFYNDAIAIGIFRTLWPNPKPETDIIDLDKLVIIPVLPINPDGTSSLSVHQNALGYLLLTGKRYMYRMSHPLQSTIQHHMELYHIFGDPGMLMYTETPTEYQNVNYSVNKSSKAPDKWVVTLGTDSTAIIGFYNESTGVVERFYTNSVTREVAPTDNYHFTISEVNKVPFTVDVVDGRTSFSGPVILQNNEITPASLGDYSHSGNGTINVYVNNIGSESENAEYTVELRDLNNNLIDIATVSENSEITTLNPYQSLSGIYVMRLCKDTHPIDYKKIIIK